MFNTLSKTVGEVLQLIVKEIEKTIDDLKEVPDFQFKIIDDRNLILKTKLQNVTNMVKDIDPNSSNNKTIMKQSNLLEFFNA